MVIMACHRSMAILKLQLILLTTIVQANVSYKTYRVDCEPHCQKIQQFSGYCPTYGSCQWYCKEKQKNCSLGTRYHCARDLNVEEAFVVACAQETFCRAGEEPRISIYRANRSVEKQITSVFCRPCFKRDRFNGLFNSSSATYSECPIVKTNLCTAQAHKIDCGYLSYRELTKTDGYCRCDARNGYAAHSEEMCFYENKPCFKKKCPDGEELLLGYSCANVCQPGFARPLASDNCHPTETSKSEPSLTASISTNYTTQDYVYIMTAPTDIPTGQPLIRTPFEVQNTIFFIVLLVLLIIIIIMVITVYWIYQNKGRCCDRRKESIRKWTAECQASKHSITNRYASKAQHSEPTPSKQTPTATESSKYNSSETVLLNLDIAKSALNEPNINGTDSFKAKPMEYPGKQTMDAVFKYLAEKDGFKWKHCLKMIGTDMDLDVHKHIALEMGKQDPYFTKVRERINYVPGYQAYKIPGNFKNSVYELGSFLLFGNETTKDIIRVAVIRSALKYYSKNVKKLLEVFTKLTNGVHDALLFFKLHGIECKNTLVETVASEGYDSLVREIVTEGKCTGPFHVELLGSVLNCKINQYFEDDCFYSQDVNRILCVNIGLQTSSPSNRELCVYWLRAGYDSNMYRIVPLLKNDQSYSAMELGEPRFSEVFKKQSEIFIKTRTKNRNFKPEKFIEMIGREVRYDFDSLKKAPICKLKETFDTNIIPGYTAYEKPENKPTCLYEWISHMCCGTDYLKFLVRLAAARYALENFKKYSKELLKTFNTSKTPFRDAELFFEIHGIECQNSQVSKKDVSMALAALVRDTVTEGKGNGPFHAEFIFGALNCKLTKHFEDNRYHDRDLETIPALKVTLTSSAPADRELHLLWKRSSSDDPYKYRILRLIKNGDFRGDSETDYIDIVYKHLCHSN